MLISRQKHSQNEVQHQLLPMFDFDAFFCEHTHQRFSLTQFTQKVMKLRGIYFSLKVERNAHIYFDDWLLLLLLISDFYFRFFAFLFFCHAEQNKCLGRHGAAFVKHQLPCHSPATIGALSSNWVVLVNECYRILNGSCTSVVDTNARAQDRPRSLTATRAISVKSVVSFNSEYFYWHGTAIFTSNRYYFLTRDSSSSSSSSNTDAVAATVAVVVVIIEIKVTVVSFES